MATGPEAPALSVRLAGFEPWPAAGSAAEGMSACFVVAAAAAAAWLEAEVLCSTSADSGRPLGDCTLAEVQAGRLTLEPRTLRAALAALPPPCRPRGAAAAAQLQARLHALLERHRGAFHRALLGPRAYACHALERVLCCRRGRQEGTYWIGLDEGDEGSGQEFAPIPAAGGGLELAGPQQAAFAALLAAAGAAAGYVYAPDEAQAYLQSLPWRTADAGPRRSARRGGDGADAALPAGIGCAFAGMAACGREVYPYLQLSWGGADAARCRLPLRLACRPQPGEEGGGDGLRAWARLARRNGPRYFAAELPRRAEFSCSRWQLWRAGADAAQLPLLQALALQHLTARSERYRVMFASSDPAGVRTAPAAGGG